MSAIGNGGIPKRYQKASIKDWPKNSGVRALIDEALLDMAVHKSGLVIEGPNGVGKTHLACAVANWLYLEQHVTRPAVFVPGELVPDLYMQTDEYRDQPWLRTMQAAQILIIDDFGKEDRAVSGTHTWKRDLVTQRIGSLLRMRVQAMRITIITTNLTSSMIAEQYGESIDSLFHEIATVAFQMTGKDKRKT